MIMMGPKKDKGGMVTLIIEKMKDHYGKGKESNEEFMEGKHDEEHRDSEVYEEYKEEVDGMFKAMDEKDKDMFAECLKMFIKKCVKDEY